MVSANDFRLNRCPVFGDYRLCWSRKHRIIAAKFGRFNRPSRHRATPSVPMTRLFMDLLCLGALSWAGVLSVLVLIVSSSPATVTANRSCPSTTLAHLTIHRLPASESASSTRKPNCAMAAFVPWMKLPRGGTTTPRKNTRY